VRKLPTYEAGKELIGFQDMAVRKLLEKFSARSSSIVND
jgi:hypothetical protein